MKPEFRVRKWQPVEGELSGRVRFFGEEHPDGIPGSEPHSMLAWCPRCRERKEAARHEECPYFKGEVVDAGGEVTAIICSFPDEHFAEEPPVEP